MHTPSNTANAGAVSEMAIVDTFTRLIFGDEGGFDPKEQTIIASFRQVDSNVLFDSYEEIGEYLRSLGVREMIHLVSRIRDDLQQDIADAVHCMAALDAVPDAQQHKLRH